MSWQPDALMFARAASYFDACAAELAEAWRERGLRKLREAAHYRALAIAYWSLAFTMIGALPAPERPAYVEGE